MPNTAAKSTPATGQMIHVKSLMDCKNALIEAEGDFARAQDIIREKGKLVVAKIGRAHV